MTTTTDRRPREGGLGDVPEIGTGATEDFTDEELVELEEILHELHQEIQGAEDDGLVN